MLAGKPLADTSLARFSEPTFRHRTTFDRRTSANCTEVSVEVFFKKAILDDAFVLLKSLTYDFNKNFTAYTYTEVCFSRVFGSLCVVSSLFWEAILAEKLDTCSFFIYDGMNHKAMPSETLLELQALLSCARKRNIVFESLSSNLYVFLNFFVRFAYIPIRAAIFPLKVCDLSSSR